MVLTGIILTMLQQIGLRQQKGRLKGLTDDTTALIFIIFAVGIAAYGYSIVAYTPQPPQELYIPTSGILFQTPDGEPVDIEAYWDVLGTQPVTQIEWPEMGVHEIASKDIWLRNMGTYNAYLTLGSAEENPPDMWSYMRLTWDFATLEQWSQEVGTWTIGSDSNLYISNDPAGRNRMRALDESRFNYVISTRVKATTSVNGRPEIQVYFRFKDYRNYYFAGLGGWGYKAAIGKFTDGVATRIAQGGNPNYEDIVLDQWYNLTVRVSGSTFTVYVDDELICTVDDATHGYGSWGLTTLTTGVMYDWVELRDPFTDTLLFADYFTGPPIKVGQSRKVKLFMESWETPPFVGSDPWLYSFQIVVTAWDEKPTV